jgi:hypothetical protein
MMQATTGMPAIPGTTETQYMEAKARMQATVRILASA